MTATRLSPDERVAQPALVCAVCGYGVARATPPARCPMCQQTESWLVSRRRPFGPPVGGTIPP